MSRNDVAELTRSSLLAILRREVDYNSGRSTGALLLRRAAGVWLALAAGFLFSLLPGSLRAEDGTGSKEQFKLPAGDARPMLRRFAQQAKREIMFPVDNVVGIRTNAVTGELTVEEALKRALAGTGLVASIEPKTGAIAVRRQAMPPHARPEARGPPREPAPLKKNAAAARAARPAKNEILLRDRVPAAFESGPTQRDPADADEDAIVMSEFRVDTRRDKGYRATNSISGTRLNAVIKDLPMPVEVITEEFIHDIGAIDAREALAFSAGVLLEGSFDDGGGQSGSFDFSPSTSGANVSPESDYKLRGFTTSVTLRHGFIVRPPNDSANISRVEVVRGPAALLYGHSILGGVINIIPKYPLSIPVYSASAAAGSFDFIRTTVDVGGPLLRGRRRQIDYRLNLAYQNRGDWTEHLVNEHVFIAPALQFRPLKDTTLFLDIEYRNMERTGGQFQDIEVANGGFDIYNRRFSYARDLFNRGPGFRWSGSDNFTGDESYTGLVQLEQKVGENITLLASHNRYMNEREQRNIRNQGVQTNNDSTPQAFRTPLPSGGTGFEAIRYEWNTQPEDTLIDSTRLEGNLRFKVDLPLLGSSSHSFLLGRQDTKQTIDFGFVARAPGQDFSWKRTDDASYFQYQGEQNVPFRDRIDERWQTGHYGVYQGKFWKERLQVIGGIRLDRYLVRVTEHDYINGVRRAEPRGSLPTDSAEEQRSWNTGPEAAAAGLPGARSSDNPLLADYRFGGRPQEQESPTVGASFRVTDEVSLYALTATGLVPNPGQRDGKGKNFDAETTKSREAGVKIDLWGGKVSGTISYFEIERDNAIWFYSFAPAPRKNRTQPSETGFDPRVPRSFGVYRTTVQAVAALNGLPDFVPQRPVTTYDGTAGANAADASDWVLNYETMRAKDSQAGRFGLTAASELEAKIMRESIEAMLTGKLPNGEPNPAPATNLNAQNDFLNRGGANWTGNSRGTDTAFGDQAKGWDAQIIVSPRDNWQMVLGYSNVLRTVTKGFQFVDFEDLTDGTNYGTEYDLWVSRFGGAGNFADPLRASTGDADTLIGLSLDDSPRHTFTFWNNYRIEQGRLRGVSLGAGVIWSDERQSTIPIGGGNLAENRYPNPPVPARTEYRLGLGYRKRIAGRDWNFRLNVNNLFDDQKDEAIATYIDDTGATIQRQTARYHRPRDIRFSATVRF